MLKGLELAVPKTKYLEDSLEGNHKQIWGSFYDRNTKKWGFACCFSCVRQSYCLGEAGKKAATRSLLPPVPSFAASSARAATLPPPAALELNEDADSDQEAKSTKSKKNKKEKKPKQEKKSKKKRKRSSSGSASSSESEKKVKKLKQNDMLTEALEHEKYYCFHIFSNILLLFLLLGRERRIQLAILTSRKTAKV